MGDIRKYGEGDTKLWFDMGKIKEAMREARANLSGRSRRPFDPLPIPHYHAIVGLMGHLPSISIPCETIEEAATRLAKIQGLSEGLRLQLLAERWLDSGVSYTEISECHDSCSAEGIE